MALQGKLPVFRVLKGDHVSHFHPSCPEWPTGEYYEPDKPLWWGRICEQCGKLTDEEARRKNQ